VPAVDRLTAYVHCNDDPLDGFVVLDQQADPFGAAAEMFQLGLHHFAFWVDSVDAIVERAQAAGHEPYIGPLDLDSIRYGEPPGSRMRTVLYRDPDGNIVQCDERGG
jgi:catechol 2,3-dioxygenase-like lactoylglutathione lyase family enzyme